MSGDGRGRRRNRNRGYRDLRVWQEAVAYYVLTCRIFRAMPYVLRRVAANQIAAVDSIHRNIAEGYCRRSGAEHLRYLNIALSSLGESVSGLHAYRDGDQITDDDFQEADTLAYKLENGLIRLIERVARKRADGEWDKGYIVQESNEPYGGHPDA